MFFDVYESLCQRKGKKPSVVAAELGINKSNVSNWKNNGYTPRGDALQRIADYFGVSTDYLLGKEIKPTVSGGLADKNQNLIRIAGRDGSYQERTLTDEQLAAVKAILDQMPDVPDDL